MREVVASKDDASSSLWAINFYHLPDMGQDTHYAKADNVVQIYFQRRSYLPRLKRSSTKEEHRISRFQLLRLWEEKIFPRDKKKYKTYNIYNRIQFLADKFALSISSNATNLFGYPYESRELKILSVVGQNV